MSESYKEFVERMNTMNLAKSKNPALNNRSLSGIPSMPEKSRDVFEAEKLNAEFELAKAQANLALAEIRVESEKSQEDFDDIEPFNPFVDETLGFETFDNEDLSFDENEIDNFEDDEESQGYEENDFEDDDF